MTIWLWMEAASFCRLYLFSDLPEKTKDAYLQSIRSLSSLLSPPVMESAKLQIQADMAYQFIQTVLGKEDIN